MNCLRCGYDLSHTAAYLACPECGLAAERSITASLHPDDAPPRWVWSIAWATLLLLLAYLLLAAVALWATSMDFSVLDSSDAYLYFIVSAGPWLLMLWLGLVGAATALLHWIANVLLSRDDRSHRTGWRPVAHRWSLRLVPLGPLAAAGMLVVLALAAAPQMQRWWFYDRIAAHFPLCQLSMLVLAGVFILCPTLSFFRLRWLALRLGRRRLARHIAIVATGLGLTLAICLFVTIPAIGIIRHAGAAFTSLVVLPTALFGLFTSWSLLLLFVICPLFFQSALHAKQKWVTADAARGAIVNERRGQPS